MTSMRIDKGASAELWAKRLAKLLEAMEEDGVIIGCDDSAILYKGDERQSVFIQSGDEW